MGTNKKKVSGYSALDQRGLFSQKTQFLFPHPTARLHVEYREIEMPQFPPKCSLWHSGFTSPQLHFVTLDGFPVRVVIPQDIQFNSRAFYVFLLFLGRPLFPLYLFLVTALSVPLFFSQQLTPILSYMELTLRASNFLEKKILIRKTRSMKMSASTPLLLQPLQKSS